MFLKIPQDYKKLYAYYILSNESGSTIAVGIVPYAELTMLTGQTIPPEGAFLTVIDTDEDRYKLANRAISDLPKRDAAKFQWVIRETVIGWQKGKRTDARPIKCNETGETFKSANAAATAHNVNYIQLLNHLNGKIGFKTVKGRTYSR